MIGSTRWLAKSPCWRQNDRYSQLSERRPKIGSQPSWTPNRSMSRSASQKAGVAKHTKTKTVVILSKVDHGEGDEGDADQQRDGEEEAPQRVPEHGALLYPNARGHPAV